MECISIRAQMILIIPIQTSGVQGCVDCKALSEGGTSSTVTYNLNNLGASSGGILEDPLWYAAK